MSKKPYKMKKQCKNKKKFCRVSYTIYSVQSDICLRRPMYVYLETN